MTRDVRIVSIRRTTTARRTVAVALAAESSPRVLETVYLDILLIGILGSRLPTRVIHHNK
jgi:hypothetical protein